MGEAHVRGHIDIEGDVEAAVALVEKLRKKKHLHELLALLARSASGHRMRVGQSRRIRR